jgi:hypothetical protein
LLHVHLRSEKDVTGDKQVVQKGPVTTEVQ